MDTRLHARMENQERFERMENEEELEHMIKEEVQRRRVVVRGQGGRERRSASVAPDGSRIPTLARHR